MPTLRRDGDWGKACHNHDCYRSHNRHLPRHGYRSRRIRHASKESMDSGRLDCLLSNSTSGGIPSVSVLVLALGTFRSQKRPGPTMSGSGP